MNYTKIQKFIASILIPFFLFGLVFRFPIDIFQKSSAGNTTLYSLVSILVDNKIYNNIKSDIERYSLDIQKQMNNTKVVIIPTPKNANSFQIASLNEKLFYEGYKGIKKSTNFESKLVGTILVGNFPIPIVYKNNEATKTILPYTDFIDKSFIYDHKTKKYRKNTNNLNGIKPEIWHGVISPNLGNEQKNIKAIKDYLSKNHDYYTGKNNFKSENGIINGIRTEKNSDKYEPYVFYFDQFREQKSLSYSKYLGYKAYLENKEDIIYKRYSKKLADKIKGEVLDDSNEKINDLIKEIEPSFNFSTNSNGPDTKNSPDILTKHIIDKTTKKFIEIINSSKIGELRKNVYNAGRYSTSSKKVNVDMIPYMVSAIDDIEDNILKGVNHTLEEEINKLIIDKGLSRNIAIPTTIHYKDSYGTLNNSYNCDTEYENILFGNIAKNITSAKECSIYLGTNSNSGQLVEANRGLNIKNIQDDIKACNLKQTSGYWGGSSPVNLNMSKATQSKLELNNYNLKSPIRPVFEVQGSFKIEDNSKTASPLDCLKNNYFVSYEQTDNFWGGGGYCSTTYQIPINGQSAINWGCGTNNKKYIFNKTFKDLYSSINGTKCDDTKKIIYLNGNKIKETIQEPYDIITGSGCAIQEKYEKTFSYKTIPSYIKHTSPTYEELNIQTAAKITPNLGIDKNRYIDFISAKGSYSKIEYPYLFRLNKDLSKIKDFDTQLKIISIELDKLLNNKSKEINNIIKSNNPSTLSGVDLEIYNNYLKNTDYPNANIDLLKFIKNQPSKKINIAGEEKELSYYDSLVFSIFWNNLNSIGQKYKFIFENYLSDQTDNKYKHFLPKNKKIYDIAYLGAPGDSQNMYIKLDPEAKGKNPFSDINLKNSLLNADILAFGFSTESNGYGNSNNNGVFECAPPEGVPLWEWPQAIFCRLGKMMPPKIKIGGSKCSSETLFEDDLKQNELRNNNNSDGTTNSNENLTCKYDLNNNGVEDCIENELKNAKLELISSNPKSYINKYIKLEARFINTKGELMTNLNNLAVNYELIKIEAKKDEKKDLIDGNIETVYDSKSLNEISEENKKKFISFTNGYAPTQKGISKYYLNSKNKEANYYIQANIGYSKNNNFGFSTENHKINQNTSTIKLKSEIIKIKIREELFFSNSFRVNQKGEIKNGADNIFASNKSNIYLIDLNKTNINKIKEKINYNSDAKEKLIIALNHYSKGNKQISLDYPLKVSLLKDGKKVLEDINIIESNLSSFKKLYSLKESGEYKIKIRNKNGEVTNQTFTVIPEIADNIELNLGTNVLENSGIDTSNIIILKDKYGNIASGKNYKVVLESKGNFVFPTNDGNNLEKKEINIYNGYKGFIIKPGDKSGVGKIKISVLYEDKILSIKEKAIQTIDKINLQIEKPTDIKVGKNKYNLKINFVDSEGYLLHNLNTRIYFGINKIYGKTTKDYFDVINGKANIEFITTNLAGQNIPIELKTEGIREIKKDTITINPEKAIKLDLILSKTKLRASPDSKTNLRVELKDIYNNLVFNDNSTKIKLFIDEKYKKIISTNGNSIKTISNGTNNFELKATPNPGTAYFKISTIPSLSNNSYTFGDKTINGVGEKAASIQTFFFWNKDTFKEKKYNGLYTVMLGAAYGDITKENYLAGSILFDKNNRNLAVTSLISNPYKFSDIIRFSKNSKIENLSKGNNLSQDISLITGIDNNKKLFINLYNKALNNQVGKIYYNFSNNINLGVCKTTIGECGIEKNKNSINLKSINSNYTITKSGNKLFLNKAGTKILTVNSDGTFSKNGIISLEIDNNPLENYLIFNIKSQGKNVAKLIINSNNSKFINSRSSQKTNTLLNTNNNLIIIELSSYDYGTHKTYSEYGENINIYYNDPFTKPNSLNSFAKSNLFGLENFEKEGSIGWKGDNKFLLNFASGQKIGEAVKDNQSIGTINLGDPVISLKKNKNKFKDGTEKSFDSTIGKLLSTDDDISGYKVFDYDNDGKNDILLIKNDGFFKLLENKNHSQKFLDKGNLAYIADSGNKKFVHAGDFTGDGYDDIFFVNNKGKPYLLNNVLKDFSRFNLKKQFKLNGELVQVESFDMDNDGKLDIITLDESGEINIFYGGGTSTSPKFTKKFIGNGFGLKLSNKTRNNGALVYFDGLYQLSENADKNKTAVNTEFLDKQIFVKIPYGNTTLTGAAAVENAIPKGENISTETKNSITNYLKNNKNIKYSETNYTKLTTFIKSEYSEASGIKIEKKFIDKNGGNLKTGDIVNLEIKITNVSTSEKNNITYIDNIEKPFSITNDKIIFEQGEQHKAPPGFDFLINKINLSPGESTIIKIKLKTPKLNFGNIRVGLLEPKGTIGEDNYGDIIVSKDNQNCSDNINIYNSDNNIIRTYSDLKNRPPVCDENKLKLPKGINPNIEEETKELLNDTKKAQEYAEEQNKKLDEEGTEVETEDALSVLDKLNKKTDEYVEKLDNLIEGFACGFGSSSCIATPLNWAPLAPGNDPTLWGTPIGDGLKVGEGLPILSGLTGINVPTTGGCYQIPTIWPASPFQFQGTCTTTLGAGGSMGINSPTNFVRLFVTPTLTGGVGTAVCFGGPASVVGNSNPQGVHPIVPGGNCIVTAKPLLSCSNDASEGDPESMGQADNFGLNGNGYGIINGNCSNIRENNATIDSDFIFKYYTKKINNETFDGKFEKEYKKVIKEFNSNFKNSTTKGTIGDTPLFSINGQGVGGYSLQSSINFSNSGKETFEDIIQVKKDRVSPFPSFLMDWVTRQIEEAVTKLSDFPTLFVILPDFSGIIDTDWKEHFKETDDEYKKGVEKEKNKDKNTQKKINALESQKASLKCGNGKNTIKCLSLDVKIKQLYAQKGVNWEKGQESGIREAYEFLGNVPIVEITPQRVNVNIPWLEENAIDKALINWKTTVKQRENEVNINDKLSGNAKADASKLISTLKQNISTLEEYKKFPRKLTKLLNQKEIRINQVMCNVESISEITNGWIGRNGKRFKAWVQTFIAIKAILKSWQLLVDVFIDYDSECHECKNERNDLLNSEFKLVDMILPKFPVIKFPKLPDIILDLHSIRANINIKIPDINLTKRTVSLPTLPKLILPTGNFNGNLGLPSMPLLPIFEIPELPDLPTLPTVTLPDLPPPPTLPKIFTSLEGVLKILKLVTKAMCLLKQLPFVPEWRAGDQIAFLTERNGYMPTDFVDMSLPDFSFPYVDAIKISTFVNLEKDNSFLTEILKNVVQPLNTQTNDFTNSFRKAGFDNLDFSGKSININKKKKIGNDKVKQQETKKILFNKNIGKGIIKLFSYIKKNSNIKSNSSDFIYLVNKSLSSKEFSESNNSNIKQIKKIWKTASNYSYSKENKLISELQKNNTEKFSNIADILNNELRKNKIIKNSIKQYINKDRNLFIKISAKNSNKDFVNYNKTLEKYNKKFLISAKKLVKGGTNIDSKIIKKEGNKLLSRINGGLNNYRKDFAKANNTNLLAEATTINTNTNNNQNSCQQANSSPYHYNYKGLYIIENNKSYRLFNYLDELSGKEKYSPIDYDSDGDDDLLYFVNSKLYLKENLKIETNANIIPSGTEILNISDNPYFNGKYFIEAVNEFKEINTDAGVLNLNFDAPTDDSIKHFRIEYYTIVDKFLNKNDNSDGIKKHIIEAFVKNNTNNNIGLQKNNAFINSIGEIPAVVLNTPEMINIGESLTSNNRINISATTRIYTANNSAKIKYYIGNNSNSVIEKEIPKNSNINFNQNITIISINGKVYSRGKTNISLTGRDIEKYIGLPLFNTSNFNIIPDLKNKLDSTKAHIEIKYAGGNNEKSINFTKTDSYIYYDLGNKSSSYLIRIDSPNDYFYGKIYAIKGDTIGTYSKQTLFSPQVEADNLAPELNISDINGVTSGIIRIPVYQSKTIDFKNTIYENSGINGIKTIKIELGENSNIKQDNIKIIKTFNKINITFGIFNKLFKEKINIILEDNNGNISNTPIDFEVYSPIPQIEQNNNNEITGIISEELSKEPISIYRIRAGGLKRLKTISNKMKVDTTGKGTFNFNYSKENSGLLLKSDIEDIAIINENTGKIKIKNTNYKIKVIKDKSLFPKFTIVDSENNKIYYQYIKLEKNNNLQIVEDYTKTDKNGLYLNIIDSLNTDFYKIPAIAKYSAGAVAIHKKGNTNEIYFKIFPDGRVDYDETNFYIEYKNIGKNIIIELKSRNNNKIIAELFYKINASYLIK